MQELVEKKINSKTAIRLSPAKKIKTKYSLLQKATHHIQITMYFSSVTFSSAKNRVAISLLMSKKLFEL